MVLALRESEVQPSETIAREKIVIDRKTLLFNEQKQQASDMLGLKGGVETVCRQRNPFQHRIHASFPRLSSKITSLARLSATDAHFVA